MLKKISAVLTIIGTVYSLYELMIKVFNTYEKKHGKKII